MPRGGARAGAGRKPGAITKRTREIADGLATDGLTPLEYMLSVLRDPTQTQAVRMDAAKAASPYIHPRLANIEQQTKLSGADGGAVQFEDVTRALENAFEKVKGKRESDV